MHIHVDTAADPKSNLAPLSLRFDGRNVGVADVVDQWWGPEERYFKVKDALDNTYILRFDQPRSEWELLMFLSKRGAAVPGLLGKSLSPRPPHAAANGKL